MAGVQSTLTGYDNRGNRLGSFEPADGYPEDWPEIEPPPGWERVPGGPIVFIERTPPTDSG